MDTLSAGFYWYYPDLTDADLPWKVRQDVCAPPYIVYLEPGQDADGQPCAAVWQLGMEHPLPFARLPGLFFGRLFTPDPWALRRAGQGIVNPLPARRTPHGNE